MLYYYSDQICLYFEEDESWMIDEILKISVKLIEIGTTDNTQNLISLFEKFTEIKDSSILYGKMLHKVISYISRSNYSILSTEPFHIEKYK